MPTQPPMDAPEVLAVLDLLAAAGADVWVDGGWGVDALLATTTRRHSDLDLVVRLPELATVRQALREAGYDRVLRDWSPVAVALVDRRGHEIDLHLIRPTADGGGDQAQLDGDPFHYPPPVTGTVAGSPVRCVDAATQVRAHLGYPPTDIDRQDMRALRDRLGVALPPPRRRGPSS